MSNVGQALGAVVGAVIGFYVGGPTGAAYGFQLGLLAGSALFPTQLPGVTGPRLDDLRTTTSVLGSPVCIVYGVMAVPGTVIYLAEPTEHSSSSSVGGKGAPEQNVTSFTYTQTVAIGLCEGPIAALRRIWENGQLVYDARPQQDEETDDAFALRQNASSAYGTNFTLYLGTEDQLADPTIEIDKGVGNVPAYRGLAYIVYANRLLRDDQARRHPNFKFEVVKSGELTCEPYNEYANEVLDPWSSGSSPVDLSPYYEFWAYSTGNSSQGPGISDIGPFEHVGDAQAELALARGDARTFTFYLGHSDIFSSQPEILGGPVPSRDRVSLYLHYASFDSDDVAFPLDFVSICATADIHPNFYGPAIVTGVNAYYAKSMTNPAGTDTYLGSCNVAMWANGIVRVNRITHKPPSPCEIGVPSSIAGYCLVDGVYYSDTDWTRIESEGSFKVLQIYGDDGTGVDRFPRSPALPVGDPRDTQAFWEAAYASALSIGYVEPGLVYGDDYPVVQDFAYYIEGQRCTVSVDAITLASIVEDICNRCGLTNIDVSDLEEVTVDGYGISRTMPGRSGIDPLRSVGLFDVVESDGTLKFITRGHTEKATLVQGDLGAYEYGAGESPPNITTKKVQDVDLPRSVRVHYFAASRDYEPGEQISPVRVGTDAVNDIDVELAVNISDDRAAQLAEIMWSDAWESRWSHETTLDRRWLELDPTDRVIAPIDGRNYRLRIVTTEDSNAVLRRTTLVRDSGDYASEAIASVPANTPSTLSVLDTSGLVLLDIPLLQDSDNDPGMYGAVYRLGAGTTWTGAHLYRSIDGGVSFQYVLSTTATTTLGELVSPAAVGITTTWDDASELFVTLDAGELESRTREAVLNGANAAAIGAPGRWEIVQFANVEELTGGVFRLSDLLRGRRGTEHVLGTSQAGDRFVFLSGGSLVRVPVQVSEIGAARVYRIVTNGATLSSGTDQTATSNGAALETFSPADFAGEFELDGDLALTWIRRGRIGQELPGDSDITLSEETEAYEVDVSEHVDFSVVARVITSAVQSATYSAANQASDFGSPLPATLYLRVYQMSATVGRGTPAELSLEVSA